MDRLRQWFNHIGAQLSVLTVSQRLAIGLCAAMAVGSEGVPVDAPLWPPPAAIPRDSDLVVPPADRDLTLAWRWVGVAVVAACCVLVLWVLHPSLLLRNTTPNGGDLGAHVWFPAFLRYHLLPDWRVAGWSNDWFGGFPAGQF